jgi:hypothetical protein
LQGKFAYFLAKNWAAAAVTTCGCSDRIHPIHFESQKGFQVLSATQSELDESVAKKIY